MGEVNFPTLSVWEKVWRRCDLDPGACPRVKVGGLISSLFGTDMAAVFAPMQRIGRRRCAEGKKDVMMIHDLERQGLSNLAIARCDGHDPKTVRKRLNNGLEPPVYGPRPPRGSFGRSAPCSLVLPFARSWTW